MQETQVQSPGQEHLPGEEMATHSRIFAGTIPCTEEQGVLQSMGSQSQKQLNTHILLILPLLFWESSFCKPEGYWGLQNLPKDTHLLSFSVQYILYSVPS